MPSLNRMIDRHLCTIVCQVVKVGDKHKAVVSVCGNQDIYTYTADFCKDPNPDNEREEFKVDRDGVYFRFMPSGRIVFLDAVLFELAKEKQSK